MLLCPDTKAVSKTSGALMSFYSSEEEKQMGLSEFQTPFPVNAFLINVCSHLS